MKKLSAKSVGGLFLVSGLAAASAYAVVMNYNKDYSSYSNEVGNKQTLNYTEKEILDKVASVLETHNEVATLVNNDAAVVEAEAAVTEATEKVEAAKEVQKEAEAELKAATTQVNEAKAKVEEAEAKLKNAKTAEEVKEAKAALNVAQKEVKTATKNQQAATDKVDKANEKVEKATENQKQVTKNLKEVKETVTETVTKQVEEKKNEEVTPKVEEKVETKKEDTKTSTQSTQTTPKKTEEPKKETQNNSGRQFTDEQWEYILKQAAKGQALDEQAQADAVAAQNEEAEKRRQERLEKEAQAQAEQQAREEFEEFIAEQNEEVKHWDERNNTIESSSVLSSAADNANANVQVDGEHPITVNRGSFDNPDRGYIWFVEFNCDMSQCVGFPTPGSSKLAGSAVIGRRGSIDSITMNAPKARAGYRFKEWSSVTTTNKYGVKMQTVTAIYEAIK